MVVNRNMTIESCAICRIMCGRLEPMMIIMMIMMMMMMGINIDLVLG